MDDSQNHLSVRDARAHFAELITRAQGGTPTIITRNGQPVAAVVPIVAAIFEEETGKGVA